MVPTLRLRRNSAGHRGPRAGARAARVAPRHPASDGPPLPCTRCAHVWRRDTSTAAEPRAKLSRRALRWALVALVVQHLSVARTDEALGVAWDTANDVVLAGGKRILPGHRRPARQRTPHPAHRHGPAHRQARESVCRHCSAADEDVEVEAIQGIYHRLIRAYRHTDRNEEKETMPPRHLERAHPRPMEWPPRASPRLRPRVPQPHPLQRPMRTRGQRLQPTTPPSSRSNWSGPQRRGVLILVVWLLMLAGWLRT